MSSTTAAEIPSPVQAGIPGALPGSTALAQARQGRVLHGGAQGVLGHRSLRSPTAAQAAVAPLLLDELTGVYRGQSLGTLAHELSMLLDSRSAGRG